MDKEEELNLIKEKTKKIKKLRNYTKFIIVLFNENNKFIEFYDFVKALPFSSNESIKNNWIFLDDLIIDKSRYYIDYGVFSPKYIENLNSEAWKDLCWILLTSTKKECTICDLNEAKEIHHLRYESCMYNLPWLYPSSLLYCLCRDCHQLIHDQGNKWRKEQFKLIKKNNTPLYPKDLKDSVLPFYYHVGVFHPRHTF